MNRLLPALLLIVVGTHSALAADLPYFRFLGGKDQGGPGTGGEDPIPVPTAENLAFAAGTPLADGFRNTPVSGTFVAKGGKAPYGMRLVDTPAGVNLTRISAVSWQVSGILGEVGAFENALVELQDAAGGKAEFRIPVTVSQRPAPSAPLAIASKSDLPETFESGTEQGPYYFSATGGTAPYAWRVDNAPDTFEVGSFGPYGIVRAVVGAPATYTTSVVTVRDADGAEATYTLRPYDVTASLAEPIVVSGLTPPPATLKVGQTWKGPDFTLSGGSGSFTDVSITKVPSIGGLYEDYDTPDPNDRYPLLVAGRDLIGPHPDLQIRVKDSAGHVSYFDWGSVSVTLDPLVAAEGFPAVDVAFGAQIDVSGHILGGSGEYEVSVGMANGPGLAGFAFTCSTQSCPGGSTTGYGIGVQGLADKPGTYTVTVSVKDTFTQEVVAFQPFRLTVAAPPAFEVVAQFPETTSIVQGDYLNVGAHVRGGSGSGSVDVTVSGLTGFQPNLDYANCGDRPWTCGSFGNVGNGDGSVSLTSSSAPAGTYADILVTARDTASNVTLSFRGFTVVVRPPPINAGSCRGIGASDAAFGVAGQSIDRSAALRFNGGVAPFTVAFSDPQVAATRGLSFGEVTTDVGGNHTVPLTLRPTAAYGVEETAVVITSADNSSCSVTVATRASPAPVADGAVTMQADFLDSQGAGASWWDAGVTTLSYAPSSDWNRTVINNNQSGSHPCIECMKIDFVPPPGLSVVSVALASAVTPLGNGIELLPATQVSDSIRSFASPATYALMLQAYYLRADRPPLDGFPSGDYRYRYYVLLSDGQTRLTPEIVVTMP